LSSNKLENKIKPLFLNNSSTENHTNPNEKKVIYASLLMQKKSFLPAY